MSAYARFQDFVTIKTVPLEEQKYIADGVVEILRLTRSAKVVGFSLSSVSCVAIFCLQLADELILLTGDFVQLIVSKLSPLLLGLAFDLFPLTFYCVPVHRSCSFVSIPALGQNMVARKCMKRRTFCANYRCVASCDFLSPLRPRHCPRGCCFRLIARASRCYFVDRF
jgi:hypothetical protein